MTGLYNVAKIVPWMGHAAAARLDTLARRRAGRAKPAAEAGLLDDDWGIGGVSFPATPLYGKGIYRTRAIVLRLPAAAVAAMLPAGLSLATADASGTHPVLLFFGTQSDVRANLWPFPGWTYHETVIGIPDVQALDATLAYQGPFAFMPRLWLDKLAPVLAGVLGYGYAKQLARIETSPHRYTVHDRAGPLLADAQFAPAGPAGKPDHFSGWGGIERLLDQPLLAEPARGIQIGSVLSFRTQTLKRVQPLSATVTLAPGAVPHFTGGTFTAAGLDGETAAFEMESHWRITPPMPRACFAPAADTHPQPAQAQGDLAWSPPRRRRIAVLGGGVGAMTAAWALTQQKDWQDLYEITVYQAGWRLGGKGASGRNPALGQRIEEHGLHIWAGFYENAFRMMRDVYGELGRPPGTPLATFDDAFKPHRIVTIEDNAAGPWESFTMAIPRGPGEPGIGEPIVPLNPLEYIPMLIDLISMMLPNAPAAVQASLHDHPVRRTPWSRASVAAARRAGHVAATDGSLLDAAKAAAGHASRPGAHRLAQLHAVLGLARAAQQTRTLDTAEPADVTERMFLHAIDLALATLSGMIADRLIFKGFAAADGMEWKAWLTRHGARKSSVEGAMVRATYDYVFGFADGDTSRPALAAGTTTHGVLRLMLTYRGAFFWAMQAGMGDTIFGPLYRVLQARGVRFEYFHRVRSLHISPDRRDIARIEIARQARPLDEAEGYDPMVTVQGLESWPSEPVWDRLQNGAALRDSGANLEHADGPFAETRTLKHGCDFDDVVLGISLGALPEICRELVLASPRWQTMVDKVKTVATLGVQLWFEPDLAGLGWKGGDTIATAYTEPLDTWADMNWLLPREDWPGPVQPQSVIYLCGTLADAAGSGDTAQEAAIARGITDTWLQTNAGHLWPKVSRPDGALDYAHLFAPGGGTPAQRFAAQYFRANTRGSERYVQTVPGATKARLRPGESGFDNLWLAGDWVRTGMNAGCVEAGAMGGLGAAAALTGRSIDIVDLEDEPIAETLLEHAIDTVHPVALTDALVVVVSLDRAIVQGLLPEGLELAAQALAPDGQAPVMLVLARHRHARLNVLPLGLGFRNLQVLVPATRPTDRRTAFELPGPYAYVARNIANSRIMAGLAHALYGEGGEFGRIGTAPGGADRVSSAKGETLLSLSATPRGARVRAPASKHFAELDWLMGRPLIARAPLGGWRLSKLDWRLAQASVQGLDVTVNAAPALRLGRAGLRLTQGDAGLLSSFRIWAEIARSNPLLGLRRKGE